MAGKPLFEKKMDKLTKRPSNTSRGLKTMLRTQAMKSEWNDDERKKMGNKGEEREEGNTKAGERKRLYNLLLMDKVVFRLR